jgi:glycosyltransferase involved in cell wall biosynthesis
MDGALGLKHTRKRAWLAVANALRMHAGILWHATTPGEIEEITGLIRPLGRSLVASNLSAPLGGMKDVEAEPHPDAPSAGAKPSGVLYIASLARISRKKNLAWAIERLVGLPGQVQLDVYGAFEDPLYLAECQAMAAALRSQVQVRFLGHLPQRQVAATLARYHLFFLPTLGENFAHVVHEAMAAGCPVLLSNRTPWRGLAEKGAGWDLPLEEPESFRQILATCVNFDADAQARASAQARAYAVQESLWRETAALEGYRSLFQIRDAY